MVAGHTSKWTMDQAIARWARMHDLDYTGTEVQLPGGERLTESGNSARVKNLQGIIEDVDDHGWLTLTGRRKVHDPNHPESGSHGYRTMTGQFAVRATNFHIDIDGPLPE